MACQIPLLNLDKSGYIGPGPISGILLNLPWGYRIPVLTLNEIVFSWTDHV
jgi:hypothetical protein